MQHPEVAAEVIFCAKSGFDAYVPGTARTAGMLEVVRRAELGKTFRDPR